MIRLGRIRLTLQGEQRATDWVGAVNTACQLTAEAALLLYYDRSMGVPSRTPQPQSGEALQSRLWLTGHPSESERPHLFDVLLRPSMGTVVREGSVFHAYYGKRSELDDLRPMYWRRDWGHTGRYTDILVQQEGPPIWKMVEYGTDPHTISPRSDRKFLRYVRMATGELVFARFVARHPGAFRGQGISLFRAVQGGLTRTLPGGFRHFFQHMTTVTSSNMSALGMGEPMGAAPFRNTQAVMLVEIQNLLYESFQLNTRTRRR